MPFGMRGNPDPGLIPPKLSTDLPLTFTRLYILQFGGGAVMLLQVGNIAEIVTIRRIPIARPLICWAAG
jgi:hypothetical protein